ncbi:hypothetical protein ABIF44_003816 [Bradyrhizobium japonicum]|nr:hypothetical protein [Bradyrhizobium japonicum]MCS4015305.1 hypothetical protein [Bradyrhizobium japonicum]MCS4202399.1 hypothetical protein [Bradyrhizobium japonicum]
MHGPDAAGPPPFEARFAGALGLTVMERTHGRTASGD